MSAGSTQDAQEAADLADAHSDSPVLRALSAMPVKASADKAVASEPRSEATQSAAPNPANPASASKSNPRPLGETLHTAVKDLAVNSGAMEAKHLLSTEFGSDKATDANAETNVLRRRANGDTNSEDPNSPNAQSRSPEQTQLDEEQASFLASALIREVTPWAIGAAVLLCCAQGLRAMLVFGRRQTERKRKYRKSSGTRNARL
nr:hypothetical protein [uncultured Albidiferax sp.]